MTNQIRSTSILPLNRLLLIKIVSLLTLTVVESAASKNPLFKAMVQGVDRSQQSQYLQNAVPDPCHHKTVIREKVFKDEKCPKGAKFETELEVKIPKTSPECDNPLQYTYTGVNFTVRYELEFCVRHDGIWERGDGSKTRFPVTIVVNPEEIMEGETQMPQMMMPNGMMMQQPMMG